MNTQNGAANSSNTFSGVISSSVNTRHLKDLLCFNPKEYFEFPPGPEISGKARSFITGLICEREVRLGRKGTSDFRSHSFFCGLDWGSLHKLPAPFLPEVSNPTDTSNFDILDDCLSEMVLSLDNVTYHVIYLCWSLVCVWKEIPYLFTLWATWLKVHTSLWGMHETPRYTIYKVSQIMHLLLSLITQVNRASNHEKISAIQTLYHQAGSYCSSMQNVHNLQQNNTSWLLASFVFCSSLM